MIKLGNKKYIDQFFQAGSLQLSSFTYYNAFDHPEIGDVEEGMVTLVAKTPFGVMAGKYGSGYKHRKSMRYSHQREFIFLWELPQDVSGAEIVDCSVARQYCKPF